MICRRAPGYQGRQDAAIEHPDDGIVVASQDQRLLLDRT
jgi:hypothetical protein